MIRFFCPLCHHKLKVPDEKAGAVVSCPRCNERAVVPAGEAASAGAGRGEDVMRAALSPGAGQPRYGSAPSWGRAGALLSGQRAWRLLVALVTAVGALSLLVAVLAPALGFSEASIAVARREAVVVVPACLVLLFVLLHGQGTSCPECGRPWARTEGETESLGREEFQKRGVSWVRARLRTSYACKHCRHNWSATYTDEYKGTLKGRPRPADE